MKHQIRVVGLWQCPPVNEKLSTSVCMKQVGLRYLIYFENNFVSVSNLSLKDIRNSARSIHVSVVAFMPDHNARLQCPCISYRSFLWPLGSFNQHITEWQEQLTIQTVVGRRYIECLHMAFSCSQLKGLNTSFFLHLFYD